MWGGQRQRKSARANVKIGGDRFAFGYGSNDYSTSWNASTNKDGDTGRAVRTKNVVVLSVQTHRDRHTTSYLSEFSETVGHGAVTIYRGGRRLASAWSLASVSSPMRFTDRRGMDIALSPGKTWVLLRG